AMRKPESTSPPGLLNSMTTASPLALGASAIAVTRSSATLSSISADRRRCVVFAFAAVDKRQKAATISQRMRFIFRLVFASGIQTRDDDEGQRRGNTRRRERRRLGQRSRLLSRLVELGLGLGDNSCKVSGVLRGGVGLPSHHEAERSECIRLGLIRGLDAGLVVLDHLNDRKDERLDLGLGLNQEGDNLRDAH